MEKKCCRNKEFRSWGMSKGQMRGKSFSVIHRLRLIFRLIRSDVLFV